MRFSEFKNKKLAKKIREELPTPTFQATDAQVNDPQWMRSQGLVSLQDLDKNIASLDAQGTALNKAADAGFPTYQYQGQTYGVRNPYYGKGGSVGEPKPLSPQQIQQISGTNILSGSGAPVTAGSKMLGPTSGTTINEFAPDGNNHRWYTDAELTLLVGRGWDNDSDTGSHLLPNQLIDDAQDWLDKQGYTVQVLDVKNNPRGGYFWLISGDFYKSRPSKLKENSRHNACPECGGEIVNEIFINEKKDACYYKVKSRYKVWPSAYASGALVKCRKRGAKNWGNSGKK